MSAFNDLAFRAQIDAALLVVRKVLDTTKHPARLADVPHSYDDKFAQVEQVTNAAATAAINALALFGLNGEAIDVMRNWAKAKQVSQGSPFFSFR